MLQFTSGIPNHFHTRQLPLPRQKQTQKAKPPQVILRNNVRGSGPGERLPNGQMLSAQQQKQLLRADNLSQTNRLNIHLHQVAPDHRPAVISSCRSPYRWWLYQENEDLVVLVQLNRKRKWVIAAIYSSRAGWTHLWKIIWQADNLHSTARAKWLWTENLSYNMYPCGALLAEEDIIKYCDKLTNVGVL